MEFEINARALFRDFTVNENRVQCSKDTSGCSDSIFYGVWFGYGFGFKKFKFSVSVRFD